MASSRGSGSLEVPEHLRNAPTQLLKSMGYGEQYRYSHNEAEAYSAGQSYLPSELSDIKFYSPEPRGLEIKLKEKLEYLQSLDKQYKNQK